MRLNLTSKSERDLEQDDFLVPGWYMAEVYDTQKDDSTGVTTVDYVVTVGPHAGKHTKDRVTDPEYIGDPAKREGVEKRSSKVCARMGLVPKDGYGQDNVEIEFTQAIGKAFVIHVEKDSFVNEKGKTVETARMGYLNMYPHPFDHERIPDDVRKELGLPPAKGKKPAAAGTTSTAGKTPRAPAANGRRSPAQPPTQANGPADVDVSGL